MIALKSLRNGNGRNNLLQKFPFVEQRRWKKAVDSAQTRLENRTRDHQLDKLATRLITLRTILHIRQLMSTRKRGPFVSVQIMSRWKNILGLNISIGNFLHKYPRIFQVFSHPLKRNLCCRFTPKMEHLISEEYSVIRRCESDAVNRIKKLLSMSKNGALHVQALRLIRCELGLPEDFRDSILGKYGNDFRLVDLENVELVEIDENLGDAAVEIWREKEYREKWLSEFETKYAFPINFPTGFEIKGGFREKLKNWQRLPYIKPYERKENVVKVRTCGRVERFEKRAAAVIHELLSLTVERRVEVERLLHFRKDFAMEVNVRELLLKHPGIFYISTKGGSQTVFLREAYSGGCLIEPNPVYLVRRKMLDLVWLGCRNTRELKHQEEIKGESDNVVCGISDVGGRGADWVSPIVEAFENHSLDDSCDETIESSGEELDVCANSCTDSEACFQE